MPSSSVPLIPVLGAMIPAGGVAEAASAGDAATVVGAGAGSAASDETLSIFQISPAAPGRLTP